ncbi:MAG: DUF2752 domain-containing protein [Verrucomicrobiia bacterium]
MQSLYLFCAKKPVQNILLAGVLVLGATALFSFNPATSVFYPKCLFHEVTGLYCPGCGTTRALHCLLHGQFREALRDNALAVVAVPVLGAMLLSRTVRRRPPIAARRSGVVWLGLLLAGIIVFGVVRNIPCRPFSLLVPPVAAPGK